MNAELSIGFVGQGYVGKHSADDFEQRGYRTVRYSLEEEYRSYRDAIRECDIVFIAVPTPTGPAGTDTQAVEEALGLVGSGHIAVVRSTIPPGTTVRLQEQYPDVVLLFSPEFLSSRTAAYEAAHPFANIIGIPSQDAPHQAAARQVAAILPKAPFMQICSSNEAEIIKYAHNTNGYLQTVFFNLLYDMALSLDADWPEIKQAIGANPYMRDRYAEPVHQTGRGAGGHCFIKDFAAFRKRYQELLPDDEAGHALLRAIETKNIELLRSSGKDISLLEEVYGDGSKDA